MKISCGKRLLSLLLAAIMVLGIIPVVTTPQVKAAYTASQLRDYATTYQLPVAEKKNTLPTTLDGKWLLVVPKYTATNVMTAMNADYKLYAVPHDGGTDHHIAVDSQELTDKGVTDTMIANRENVVTLKGTTSSFTVECYNGRFWYTWNNDTDGAQEAVYDFGFKPTAETKFSVSAYGNNVVGGFQMKDSAGRFVYANGYSWRVHPSKANKEIYFYKFNEQALALREALYNAVPYLTDKAIGSYEQDEYNNLLVKADSAVRLYETIWNKLDSTYTASEKNQVSQAAAELNAAIEAMTPKYDKLKSEIQSLAYPMAEPVHFSGSMPINGIFMVLSSDRRDITYGEQFDRYQRGCTLNPAAERTNGAYVGYDISKPNEFYTEIYCSPNRTDYSIIKGNASSFTIQAMDGRYWNLETISGNNYWTALRLRADAKNGTFKLMNSTSSGRFLNIKHTSQNWYINSNSHTFRGRVGLDTIGDTNETKIWLGRVHEEAFYLRDALQDALTFLVDNSTGRFDTKLYAEFLHVVKRALTYYNSAKLNVYNIVTADAKAQKEALYEIMGRLKLTDTQHDYIDIPIEILDFRGDGIMFENKHDDSPYALNYASATNYADGFPSGCSVAPFTGLVQGTLVNGNVVYTKATVDYIANHLSKQTALADQVKLDGSMNDFFYKKILSGTLTYDANGYAATIQDCEPKIEGGKLAWDKVNTYHDLAYYLLSNLWQKTEDVLETDTLPNGKPYNVKYNLPITELNKMRMYKDGNTYAYKSADLSFYNYADQSSEKRTDGYIYNTRVGALGKPSGDPHFKPIDNRGFESPDLYGATTESSISNAHNWLFTLHAYGAFVYTEAANLEFNFTGDDDVYFFVNGELICDIGGMHTAVTKGAKLNDFQSKLGLKDGQICRFDMFYAERHTKGINLNFTTNIEIMDENVITEKTQYDPATNQNLLSGAVMPIGSDIGYTFAMLNRRGAPVKDVQLFDNTLGVQFDGKNGIVQLNNKTQLSDLTLTYSTYGISDGKVYSGKVTAYDDFESYVALISAAVADTSTAAPLLVGAYSYSPKSEQELLTILALGIPASCKLSIRGIRHTLPTTAATFTNQLNTNCVPLEYVPGADGSIETVPADPIAGTASCICKTMDLSSVVNLGDPYALVMDYAKTVEMDLSQLHNTVTVASGVTKRFVGCTINGAHGLIKTAKPGFLTFLTAGSHYQTETGFYSMATDNIIRFTPTEIMNGANTIYAVYELSSTSFTTVYAMKAISFVPATTVYYETDFADTENGNIYKYGNSYSSTNASAYASNGGLLINFGNGDPGTWTADSVLGTARKSGGFLTGYLKPYSYNGHNDNYFTMTKTAYNYKVKPGDVVKMRIKSDSNTGTGVQVFFATTVKEHSSLGGTGGISTGIGAYTPDGNWQTVTMPIWEAVYGETVQAIRIDLNGNGDKISGNGNYWIDWVYIGPETGFNAPIVMDFDKGAASDWDHTRANVSQSNGVLKVSPNGTVTQPYNTTDAFVTMKAMPFRHVIEPNDVVRMRIRGASNHENRDLRVFFLTDVYSAGQSGICSNVTHYQKHDDWQVVELTISPSLVGTQITGLRLDVPDHLPKDYSIEYDWVYVGPKPTAREDALAFSNTDAEKQWTRIGVPDYSVQQTSMAGASNVYGYDEIYNKSTMYSGNSTIFVEGVGVPLMKFITDANDNPVVDENGKKLTRIDYSSVEAYTETTFSFTGTGFDILSRTGENQGAIRVVVCDGNGVIRASASVINKGKSELTQIPVVSLRGIKHGSYTAHIFVNAPYTNDDFPAMNRGCEFYFDAVRIYDTIDPNATDADATFARGLYQGHHEGSPTYFDIRQQLIDANSLNLPGASTGMVYLDAVVEDGVTFASDVAKYAAIGPNNEVYIESDKAISFRVEVDGAIPSRIAVGAKLIKGTQGTLKILSANSGWQSSKTVVSRTEMHYPLDITDWQTDAKTGKHFISLALICSGGGTISLTNFRMTYAAERSKSVEFVVDSELLQAFRSCSAHEHCYTDNGEDHTVGCENCIYYAIKPHSYVGGTCICGAKEIKESVFSENLTVSPSISVGAEMQVVYSIPIAKVKDFDSFYLEVVKDVADGEPVTTIFSLENGNLSEKLHPISGEVVGYSATYTGIFASKMGDNFAATLYAVAEDGTIYYGNSETSSIKTYLFERIVDSKSSPELKTLAVDMLNYGSAAQIFFGYDVENLVNADLTEEQKALGTQKLPDAVNGILVSGTGYDISTSASLQSRVLLYLTCLYASNENSNMKFVVKDIDGNILEEFAPSTMGATYCQGIYANVGARQMREFLTIELYDGDILVSKTLTWSVESYVASIRADQKSSPELIAVANAMLTYGDSAAAYLASSGQ